MSKWFICLMGWVMVFAVAGAPKVDAAGDGTVAIALTGEPATMDPHRTSDIPGLMTWRWVYDTLLSAEMGTGKIRPWLATKWESKDNNKSVKFWLRKDAKFSDGSPVTSEAVKYSMSRVMKSDPQRPYFKSFDRIEVIDDTTFIWHNKAPDNGMLNLITLWAHVISLNARDKDEATLSRNSFGSGPYVLKSWTRGLKLVYEANPLWWGDKMYPKRPKQVILRGIPEGTTRVKALMAGEVDLAWAVMPQFIPQLEKDPNTRVASVPGVRIMHMGFFASHGGPMANEKVRQAINYAIDAELIRKTIMDGRAELIGQMFIQSGREPDKRWYDHDPGKAKALLAEAGYPNGFKMVILSPVGRYLGDKATCEASAAMLGKVGVDATCKAVNFPLYQQLFRAHQSGKETGAAAYYMGFGNPTGYPAFSLRGTTSCGGSWSAVCFKDLEDAIDKALEMADLGDQQAAFDKVTDMMREKATHKIFFRLHDITAYSSRLKYVPRNDERLYPWEIETE